MVICYGNPRKLIRCAVVITLAVINIKQSLIMRRHYYMKGKFGKMLSRLLMILLITKI